MSLAVVLCMMGAAAGMAQDSNRQRGERMDPSQRIEQMVKQLGLDEAKAKEFRAAMEEMKPAAGGERPSREEMQKKREAVDKKVKAILTEEQYKKYQKLNQRPQGRRK
ncbi:MAG: hypothetical protein MR387_01155 [Phocaeicola plebeius]|nr:hypothetical protein [Phocaeicola plebeius]